MDDLTTKAADEFLKQGALGAAVVALSIALVAVVIFGWRELKAERKAHDAEIAEKDKKIFDLQEAWRNDTRTSLSSVNAALETVQHTIDALTGRR
jgi:hypothetical protein